MVLSRRACADAIRMSCRGVFGKDEIKRFGILMVAAQVGARALSSDFDVRFPLLDATSRGVKHKQDYIRSCFRDRNSRRGGVGRYEDDLSVRENDRSRCARTHSGDCNHGPLREDHLSRCPRSYPRHEEIRVF